MYSRVLERISQTSHYDITGDEEEQALALQDEQREEAIELYQRREQDRLQEIAATTPAIADLPPLEDPHLASVPVKIERIEQKIQENPEATHEPKGPRGRPQSSHKKAAIRRSDSIDLEQVESSHSSLVPPQKKRSKSSYNPDHDPDNHNDDEKSIRKLIKNERERRERSRPPIAKKEPQSTASSSTAMAQPVDTSGEDITSHSVIKKNKTQWNDFVVDQLKKQLILRKDPDFLKKNVENMKKKEIVDTLLTLDHGVQAV
jgi:hypothetical protein